MEKEHTIIALLESIDASLKAILASKKSASSAASGQAVADDRDLDSTWGDEVVRLRPRDWQGDDMKGRHMSECSAEFLDQLAAMMDYFGDKNEKAGTLDNKGRKKSTYDRKSAARARGWAARKRSGWKPEGSDLDSVGTITDVGTIEDMPDGDDIFGGSGGW